MGQAEVLEFLTRKRKEGPRWRSIPEIRLEMREEGWSDGVINGVSGDLLRLSMFKMIQWRGSGWWTHKKEFRGFRNGKSKR